MANQYINSKNKFEERRYNEDEIEPIAQFGYDDFSLFDENNRWQINSLKQQQNIQNVYNDDINKGAQKYPMDFGFDFKDIFNDDDFLFTQQQENNDIFEKQQQKMIQVPYEDIPYQDYHLFSQEQIPFEDLILDIQNSNNKNQYDVHNDFQKQNIQFEEKNAVFQQQQAKQQQQKQINFRENQVCLKDQFSLEDQIINNKKKKFKKINSNEEKNSQIKQKESKIKKQQQGFQTLVNKKISKKNQQQMNEKSRKNANEISKPNQNQKKQYPYKNIHRYMVRSIIQGLKQNHQFQQIKKELFEKESITQEDIESYFNNKFEQFTNLKILSEHWCVSKDDISFLGRIKRVFKAFSKWYLEEKAIRYILNGKMKDKQKWIYYKNKIMLYYIDHPEEYNRNNRKGMKLN